MSSCVEEMQAAPARLLHSCTTRHKIARTRLSTRVADSASGRIGRVKGRQSTDLGQGTS